MAAQRSFTLIAFLAAVCALVGFGALAAGGAIRYGTNAAAERDVALVATVVGVLLGGTLLAVSTLRVDLLGRSTAAAGALLAALVLALPATQAFAARVSTATDDSSGCGSISTPTKQLQPGSRTPELTPTCRRRLDLQKVLVLLLLLPAGGAAGAGLVTGLRTAHDE